MERIVMLSHVLCHPSLVLCIFQGGCCVEPRLNHSGVQHGTTDLYAPVAAHCFVLLSEQMLVLGVVVPWPHQFQILREVATKLGHYLLWLA